MNGLRSVPEMEPALITSTLRLKSTRKTRPEIVRILRSLIGPTQVETGCISCGLYSDLQDPNIIVWVEEWSGQDDLERHLSSEQYKKVLAALEMSVERPDVRFNTVVETKGMRLIKQARGIAAGNEGESPDKH